MSNGTYTFGEQLRQGSMAETILDQHFDKWFKVQPVPLQVERIGIDRLFIGETKRDALAVEYKSDQQAHKTGNAFVETISVDHDGKPGWVFTCKADALVYYAHESGGGRGLVLAPNDLRQNIHGWTRKYPVKTASNPGYHSYGVLVPMKELAEIAEGRFDVSEGTLDGFVNWSED